MSSNDPFDLQRFVDAQAGGTHEQALAELRAGRKTSHWMWYVFPQLRGLGHSAMAWRYGVTCLDEARAYLAHPVLGARLRECAEALERLDPGVAAHEVFGSVDTLKLRSSLTLFALADAPGSIFGRLLERYFAGERDGQTLTLLQPSR
jgi:uncharacterized protein (DUF1810 family)